MFSLFSKKTIKYIIIIALIVLIFSYIESQEKIQYLYTKLKNKMQILFAFLKSFLFCFDKKIKNKIEGRKRNYDAAIIYRKIIIKLLRTKELGWNLKLFKILARLDCSAHLNFLCELSQYYENIMKTISKESKFLEENGKQKIFINFPVWGERCAELFISYMVPSLLSSGNLPSLQKESSFHIQIFCDKWARETILKSDGYKSLLQYARVNIFHIPESLLSNMQNIEDASDKEAAKYLLYGTSQCLGARQAIQQKAYISFLNADTLIAENALSNAVEILNNGKIAVLVNSFRSNLDTIKADLKKYYDRTKNIISISSDDLIHLQVKHIHPSALRRLVSQNTAYFSILPQMLFYTGNMIVSRSIHYHPFMVSYEIFKNFNLNFGFPIDGDSNRLILPFRQNFDKFIEVIEDAKKIGVLELSPENVEPVNEDYKKYNTYQELLLVVTEYLRKRLLGEGEKYLLSKRTVYHSDHKSHFSHLKKLPLDPIDDNKFIAEVSKRLENT